jgi:hypothetical protein
VRKIKKTKNNMKTVTKLALAAFAVSIMGTGAAMAGSAVTRVDHPNGQATFVYGPQSNGPIATTIGVYENRRSFGTVSASDSAVTRAEHSNGSPTFIYAPQMNGPVGVR